MPVAPAAGVYVSVPEVLTAGWTEKRALLLFKVAKLMV
jgi:hypothetical protein